MDEGARTELVVFTFGFEAGNAMTGSSERGIAPKILPVVDGED